MNKVRLHRELLKHNLFNYDWSNTPVNKILFSTNSAANTLVI